MERMLRVCFSMCLSFYHEEACQVEPLPGKDHRHHHHWHCFRPCCCFLGRRRWYALTLAGRQEMGVLPKDLLDAFWGISDFFLPPLVFLLHQLPRAGIEITSLNFVGVAVGQMVLVSCSGVGW